MEKDFLTITPDSGEGSQTVTVEVPENSGEARSTTITVSGNGITQTISVNQEKGVQSLVMYPMGTGILSDYVFFESGGEQYNIETNVPINDPMIRVCIEPPYVGLGYSGDQLDFTFNKKITNINSTNRPQNFDIVGEYETSFGVTNIEDYSSSTPSQTDYEGRFILQFEDGKVVNLDFMVKDR